MKRSAALFLTAFSFCLPAPEIVIPKPLEVWFATGTVHAGEAQQASAWEEEFTLLCSKASMAMTLSTEELLNLAGRCDALRPALANLEETPRKIYLKRLEKTKSLYLFVIETRKNAIPSAGRNQP